MINIVLFGPPGSGKGTQAQNLIEKFNLKQISTGDLFRCNMKNDTELGQLAKSYIDKGELVPDQVTIDMLTDELKKPCDAQGILRGLAGSSKTDQSGADKRRAHHRRRHHELPHA